MVLPIILSMRNPIETDRAVQATALALGVSPEAIWEALKHMRKEIIPERGTSNKERAIASPLRSPREIRSEQLLSVVHAYPDTPLAKRVKSEYSRITEAGQLPSGVPSEPALFKAEQTFGEDPPESAADELLRAFEEAVIREAYQSSVADLRRAEASGDMVAVSRAQVACAKLSARLAAFGA
jgi:hypothetical protein